MSHTFQVKYNVLEENAEKVGKLSTNDSLNSFCNLLKVYAMFVIADYFDGLVANVIKCKVKL